ncbi:uncharacterized protein [Apostichopus japonicus]|uniref:uncharacterized protein n=1 Tax=Stichopus japonicus TaxID=307972 RepID=UPI003AB6A10C
MKLLNIFVIIILGTSLTEWIEGKPNICHYITTIDEFGKVKWMKSGTNCDIVTFGGVKQTKSEPTTLPGIGDSTEASTLGNSLEVSSKEDSTEDETTQTTTDRIGDSTEASTVGHSLEVSSKEDSTEDETTQTTTDRIGDSTEASTVGHSLEVSSKEDSTEDVTTQTTDHCTSCDWKPIGKSSYCLIHRPNVARNDAKECCKHISTKSHLACFGSFDESNHVYGTFDLSADVNIWGDCTAGRH